MDIVYLRFLMYKLYFVIFMIEKLYFMSIDYFHTFINFYKRNSRIELEKGFTDFTVC